MKWPASRRFAALALLVCSLTVAPAIAQITIPTDTNAQKTTNGPPPSGSPSTAPSAPSVTATNGFADFDPNAKPYAYVASAAIWQWPSGAEKIIYVCWENPTQGSVEDRQLVAQSVKETWQDHSQLRFQGWAKCVPGNYGIHI